VEAASRTLQNPTPQRIKSLIDTLVEIKIEEGQLDECDITMREIKINIFLKNILEHIEKIG